MKLILNLLLTLVYSLIYIYFSIDAAGAGHGTFVFFAPLITWILVFVAVILVSLDQKRFMPLPFIVLMAVHYIVTIVYVVGYFKEGANELFELWSQSKSFVLSAIVWYLGGQILLWINFAIRYSSWRRRDELRDDEIAKLFS